VPTRREFLGAATALAAPPSVRREVFLRSPGKGTAVMAHAVYSAARGGDMLSFETRMSRSDTADVVFVRRSPDHGRTWGPPEERPTREARPDGTLRRHMGGGWVDPATGRYLEFRTQGVLPTDNPLEGMSHWNIWYRVSEDGGRTFTPLAQLIHEGRDFDAAHPLPGVYTGKSCVMLGDLTCRPVARQDGAILLPAQVTPLTPEGKLYNPTNGHTYTDAVVLTGRWRGNRLAWTMSPPIQGDPARSTRGMVEPTLAWLDGGRLLNVLRGSNDRNPKLPSHKWAVWSTDGGATFTKPAPWTYSDGEPFFSPSACSQLLEHSSGRIFWLGNLLPQNPAGNRPRYPFVIGEVDRKSGLLHRNSVRTLDDLQPGESNLLTLSNFLAREDRQTREICLHMTRLFAHADGWLGDAYLYRISI
jgi:hypothetical protein